MIPTVTVSADIKPKYRTTPGMDTQDQIFLLSIPEAKRYFSSDADRKCVPTACAKVRGCKADDSGFCQWWLRSPGSSHYFAACVQFNGIVDSLGNMINFPLAVRPALWIDLGA